jgi:D-psicose/D-tagatose/L-ribulose 3-epimerase
MKFALCNEVLQPQPFEQQCTAAAAMGYDALEVAPFTLADNPMQISDAQAWQFRRVAEDAGLRIPGCTGCWSRRPASRSCRTSRRCAIAPSA